MKKYFVKPKDVNLLQKQLLTLKSICQKNNIILLCIQTTIYKSLYNKAIFDRSAKISQNVATPFIDLANDNIRNNIRNFYNSTHLNKNGVIEMNKLLKNQIKLDSFFKINP